MGEHDKDAAEPQDAEKDKVVVEGEADDDAPSDGEASEASRAPRIAFTG